MQAESIFDHAKRAIAAQNAHNAKQAEQYDIGFDNFREFQ